MSKDVNHGSLWVTGIKALVFTVVTVFATGMLALTIQNSSTEEEQTYTAIFTDITSLNRGDDVRISGVKVGSVKEIGLTDGRLAKVSFTVRKGVPIEQGATVVIKFRNMVGQRMLAIDQPDIGATSTPERVQAGHEFGVDETQPALDLTVLFNGFRPLLTMLDPGDVNALSEQIIAVFQGEDATVEGLISSTASLTSTLAEKDQVIGELITSLSSVMTAVNERSGQLDTTLVTLQTLVSGLAEDRVAIGSSLEGMGELTTRVAGLVGDTRAPLKKSIAHLGKLSGTLDENSTAVENFLVKLPTKLDAIGRTASYGSWVNMYLCSMDGRIPMVEGYMGSLGAVPVAGRCK